MCVRSRSRGVRPPPPPGGVACAPRAVPALGACRAVPRDPCPSACPAPVPCSVWRAWGGGGRVPVPPYLAWGCCCEGRLRSGAPPLPIARPLGGLSGSATHVLWARLCGSGGPTLSPWPACPVGAACRGGGVVGGRPRGGWPATVVRGVRCQALSLPRPPVPWGGQPGFRDPCVPGAVGAVVGTQHRPHDARPCGPALRAMGLAEGRPRGGCRPPSWGASGVRRSPSPGCPRSGRAAGAHYPLAVGAGGCGRGDPSPTAQRALLRAGFARCEGGSRAPGGGASGLGVGRPESGALPPPTARPLGGLPGPTTHWLWVLGGAGVGTLHRSHSARSCVLWGRHEGAGGGASCLGVGRPGSGAIPPSTACPLGGLPGPTTHWLWVRGLRAWGPVTNPTARTLACCGGSMRVPGGGASCLGVGRPVSGALPPPTARPLGGLPGPTTNWLWVRGGAGVGTRHQPHSARSCVVRGRHEGARGGRLLPGCGASGAGRSPTPDCPPSERAAGAHYPLAVGAGGCGRGDPSPTPQRAHLRAGFARCGGGMRAPGGGASCLGVGRPGSGALPPPTARPLGGPPGPTTHWLWVWGGDGVGTRHQPHSARTRELALRAVGAAQGRPGGGASCLGVVRPGSGALPPPTARPLGGLPGPTTHWLWVRGGVAVGTRHQPHSTRSCVLWGRHERARGGCLLPGCWASGVGRSPTPGRPPSGRAHGAEYPLAVGSGGCGCGPVTNPTARALVCCGGGMRVPGGGRLLPGCGASGVGRSPTPDCPPSGRARGPSLTGCGCGGVRAWGPVTNPTARATASWLCALWGQHEGARGGRLLPGCGASGVGRSPTPDCPPSGRAAGAQYPLAVGAGGAGVGTRHQPHSAHSCVLWGRHEGARGGRLLPGCGASRVGRSPSPDSSPSGRAAGAHYPLAVGSGGRGRGESSPTPQRALLRAVGAA